MRMAVRSNDRKSHGCRLWDGVKKEWDGRIERARKFGDLENPLLVSVRSGARASMPGMMDTILNLGLNDDVVAAMIAHNPDPAFERFVYDSVQTFHPDVLRRCYGSW